MDQYLTWTTVPFFLLSAPSIPTSGATKRIFYFLITFFSNYLILYSIYSGLLALKIPTMGGQGTVTPAWRFFTERTFAFYLWLPIVLINCSLKPKLQRTIMLIFTQADILEGLQMTKMIILTCVVGVGAIYDECSCKTTPLDNVEKCVDLRLHHSWWLWW